jgi:hypothetical protein
MAAPAIYAHRWRLERAANRALAALAPLRAKRLRRAGGSSADTGPMTTLNHVGPLRQSSRRRRATVNGGNIPSLLNISQIFHDYCTYVKLLLM